MDKKHTDAEVKNLDDLRKKMIEEFSSDTIQLDHSEDKKADESIPDETPEPTSTSDENPFHNDIAFDLSLRGYNTKQVDAYLVALTTEYNHMFDMYKDLEHEQETLLDDQAYLQEYKDIIFEYVLEVQLALQSKEDFKGAEGAHSPKRAEDGKSNARNSKKAHTNDDKIIRYDFTSNTPQSEHSDSESTEDFDSMIDDLLHDDLGGGNA